MTPLEASKKIIQVLHEHGHLALLAGGCVRDLLLGLTPKDYDVATDAPPDRVAALFRRTKLVGAKFGVVIVRMGGGEIEVATFRTDGTYSDGRRPDSVEFASAEVDAQRRDFTINGMFYDPFDEQVVDYVGGEQDLRAKVVRCIGDPDQRFSEDHLRLLRAIRFAARFAFRVDPATYDAMRRHASSIRDISPERIRMELEMILTGANRAEGWHLVVDSGLVDHIAPPLLWTPDQARRTGDVLAGLGEPVTIALAMTALLISRSPSEAAEACRNLRCSNETIATVEYLLSHWPAALAVTDLQLADWKMLRASPCYAELCNLVRAAARADNRSLAAFETEKAQADAIPTDRIAPPPLITGDDLLAMKVSPGPQYSRVLAAVYRAQLNECLDSRDRALALAQELLANQAPDNQAR